jgi:hypothetical protein
VIVMTHDASRDSAKRTATRLHIVCVCAVLAMLSTPTASQAQVLTSTALRQPLIGHSLLANDLTSALANDLTPTAASETTNEAFPTALEIDSLTLGTRESAPARPLTGRERFDWVVSGVVGPTSLGFTAFSAASDAWWTRPSEQARATRFARSFAIRELDLAISRSVEAGVGALWDEDPRPFEGSARGFWPKTGRALQRVVMAPRGDGHLAPAWGRFAGYAASGIAANAWVPEDQRSVQDTAIRIGSAFTGRLISNLWKEFWPDLKDRLPQPPWQRGTKDPSGPAR